MNSNTFEISADQRPERKDRAVLCAKCEKLNEWGANSCVRCGAHLYIGCNDCGQRNERVRTRCSACGRRLHHTVLERLSRRFFRGGLKITALQVVLFFVAVVLGFLAILMLSQFRGPQL